MKVGTDRERFKRVRQPMRSSERGAVAALRAKVPAQSKPPRDVGAPRRISKWWDVVFE